MKLLFFDMEFANGKVPGSIYSFGYVQTDSKFKLVQPQTDILMNPECIFNDYVRKNILAYPIFTVQKASTFPAYYKRLKKLLCRSRLAVGFAVGNDTAALRHACERYHLKPPVFQCLDMEKLCKKFPAHKQAHGLSGCVEEWCNLSPANQHRSDGDAYATMLLFEAVCKESGIAPKDIAKRFPDCLIPSVPPEEKEKPKKQPDAAQSQPQKSGTPNRRKRRRYYPRKKTNNHAAKPGSGSEKA